LRKPGYESNFGKEGIFGLTTMGGKENKGSPEQYRQPKMIIPQGSCAPPGSDRGEKNAPKRNDFRKKIVKVR